MEHREIAGSILCKQAFRKLPRRIGPYQYDMNIYRGCAHHCAYCYAVYSQRYLAQTDFYHDIFVKSNIVEQLNRQLSSPHWKRHLINIGSVSDSYQPAEASYEIMRHVLRLLIEYRTPCIISTKSDLILRDLDLIDTLSKLTYVNIAATITTPSTDIATIVEPNAASPIRRKEVLSIIKNNTHAIVGMHVMPIMPFINDDDATLHQLCDWANEIPVDYATFDILHLKGDTKRNYFQMLNTHFPPLLPQYRKLYQSGRVDQNYAKCFHQRIQKITQEHQVNTDYMQYVRAYEQEQKVEQMTFW